jgi:Na+-driven multidrug efflux pump
LNGLWLSFQAVALLGGLGDLGMGGAVGMRVSRYLGQKDEDALKHFLATARALFIALGLLVSLVFSNGITLGFPRCWVLNRCPMPGR